MGAARHGPRAGRFGEFGGREKKDGEARRKKRSRGPGTGTGTGDWDLQLGYVRVRVLCCAVFVGGKLGMRSDLFFVLVVDGGLASGSKDWGL